MVTQMVQKNLYRKSKKNILIRNKKFFFDKLSIEIPKDFDVKNYVDLNSLFKDTMGKPYSFSLVEKILDKIDLIQLMNNIKIQKLMLLKI